MNSINPDQNASVAGQAATAATLATVASGTPIGGPNHALLSSPGTETDHFAADYARDVAIEVLGMMQWMEGGKPRSTEAAVRVLLLAAAHLRWDITVAGRGELVSSMLLAGLDELRDNLVTPPAAVDAAGLASKLREAAAAGWRTDGAPAAKGDERTT